MNKRFINIRFIKKLIKKKLNPNNIKRKINNLFILKSIHIKKPYKITKFSNHL